MQKLYLTPFNIKTVSLYHQLSRQGNYVTGFFDGNSFIHNKTYDGVGIYPRCYVPNAKVIICTTEERTNDIIKNNLMELGYNEDTIEERKEGILFVNEAESIKVNELLDIFSQADNMNMGIIEDIMKIKKMKELGINIENTTYEELFGLNRKEVFSEKIFLNKFEVIVTNKCSLKCKKCAAGIQYIKEPTDLEVEQILSDYDRTIELIDWTDRIVIIGGEPFLNPNLDKVLDGIFKNPKTIEKVGAVKIITNGTVIPKTSVMDAISKYGVTVWISDYGEQSRQMGELISAFRIAKVNYYVMPTRRWSNVIQLNDKKNIQTRDCLLVRRKEGCVTRCRTMANGKFYLCSLLKTMDYLGISPFSTNDYVDLYDENAREQIMKMLSMENPLPNACSFCTGCSEEDWNEAGIDSAEQTKTPLPYIKDRH